MALTPKVSRMAIPTGPSGILQSDRPRTPTPGKKTPQKRVGLQPQRGSRLMKGRR